MVGSSSGDDACSARCNFPSIFGLNIIFQIGKCSLCHSLAKNVESFIQKIGLHIEGKKSQGSVAREAAGCIYNGRHVNTVLTFASALNTLGWHVTHAMKSDWQTVTENKQIQQSVTLAFAFLLCVSFPLLSGTDASPPSALSCLRALVLWHDQL